MFPSYKGHRGEKPPNLYEELSRMLVMVEAMGIPILSVPGVEADDVCGALAVKAVREGFDVVLVSPDRVRARVPFCESLLSLSEWYGYVCVCVCVY